MEVAALVAAVMTALTSLASGAGIAIAASIGNDVYAKGKAEATHLFETIKARFSKEKDGTAATQALQAFVDGDIDYESLIKTKLERLINADPAFAGALTQFVQSGPLQSLIVGTEAVARDIEMTNTSSEGQQIIREGDKSTIERVRMNISHGDK